MDSRDNISDREKLIPTLMSIYEGIRRDMAALPVIPDTVLDNSIRILADWFIQSPDERGWHTIRCLKVLARGDFDGFFDGMDDDGALPPLPPLPPLD